jgi:repressor LexA
MFDVKPHLRSNSGPEWVFDCREIRVCSGSQNICSQWVQTSSSLLEGTETDEAAVESVTPRQEQMLTAIRTSTAALGRAPSVRELGAAIGLTSSASVHRNLAELQRKGYIRREPSNPRKITVLRAADRVKTDGPSTHRSSTRGLTKRQQQVLQLIEEFRSDHGYPPSIREIGQALTLSTSRVHDLLKALEQKGYIRRDPAKRRALEVERPGAPPRPLPIYVPLVGQVAAGGPILAEEHVEEVVPLPRELVGEGQLFILRVRGESMIGDGIDDEDLVVVRMQDHASEGDIVIALIDDAATVKRVMRRGGKLWLAPSNPAYEPIAGTHATILGKVVAVLRRL